MLIHLMQVIIYLLKLKKLYLHILLKILKNKLSILTIILLIIFI